jgi:hypothetical protein
VFAFNAAGARRAAIAPRSLVWVREARLWKGFVLLIGSIYRITGPGSVMDVNFGAREIGERTNAGF